MGKKLIMVGSVTYAMKGKEVLQKNGISSYIERIPRKKSGFGCGYGLYVPYDIEDAYHILMDNDVRILGTLDEEEIP